MTKPAPPLTAHLDGAIRDGRHHMQIRVLIEAAHSEGENSRAWVVPAGTVELTPVPLDIWNVAVIALSSKETRTV